MMRSCIYIFQIIEYLQQCASQVSAIYIAACALILILLSTVKLQKLLQQQQQQQQKSEQNYLSYTAIFIVDASINIFSPLAIFLYVGWLIMGGGWSGSMLSL